MTDRNSKHPPLGTDDSTAVAITDGAATRSTLAPPLPSLVATATATSFPRHSDGASSWRRPVVAVAVAALAVSGLVYANASIGRSKSGAVEASGAAVDAASGGSGAGVDAS